MLWWHGDSDHIIPFAHGEHVVSRLPDAELSSAGESHLAGLGRGRGDPADRDVGFWDRDEGK